MQTVMCHELLSRATRMYLKDTVAEKYNRHRLSNIFKKQTGQHYLRKCLKRSRSLFLLLQLGKKKPADNISISDNNHPAFQFYRVFLLGAF